MAGKRSGGSFASRSNYNRMVTTFAPEPEAQTIPPDWHRDPSGEWFRWDGAAWKPQPAGPPSTRPPVSDAIPFTAEGVFNKAGLLGLIAVVAGSAAYLVQPSAGFVIVAIFAALGVGLWCSFRPRLARILAPVYAVVEGGALGALSRYYTSRGDHAVPIAVVGTAAIVAGVWFCYRTGLVKVERRFLQTTMVATLGLLAAGLLALLTGWGATGLGGFVIFGVLYLIIGVMNLFVDFSFVYQAQRAGVTAEAEWYGAFSLLVSSVMVYLALLRMLGGRR